MKTPSKRLITFLGTGGYEPVAYTWRDRESEQRFFALAAAEWIEPDEICVLLTPEAEQHANWKGDDSLRGLSADSRCRPVSISTGRNEKEMWENFTTLATLCEPDLEIVLDVTHAFRSLPILGLAAASYARALRGANISSILYGAFEARNPDTNHTPVFDLSVILELLDWTAAANLLIKTGDARPFGEILGRIQQQAWAGAASEDRESLPTSLKSVGTALRALTESLFVTHPDESRQRARELSRHIESAKPQLERWAPPFAAALDVVDDSFRGIGGDGLETERTIIAWYSRRGHWVQALTLAREWLVSLTLAQLSPSSDPRLRTDRILIEDVLNQAVARSRGETLSEPSPLLNVFDQWALSETVGKLWSRIPSLRNDVAHCGMNEQPIPARKVGEQVEEICRCLNELELTTTP